MYPIVRVFCFFAISIASISAAGRGEPSAESHLLPAPGSTGIAPDQQLRIRFDAPVRVADAGKIFVHDASDERLVATIDLSTLVSYKLFAATIPGAAVRTVQGKEYYYRPVAMYQNEAWITLPPETPLAYGSTYYVVVEDGVFVDQVGNPLRGIARSDNWHFSTKASAPHATSAHGGPVDVTVGHDGAGDFATLQAALDWIPEGNQKPRTIRLLPGFYHDSAVLGKNRNFVSIVGGGETREAVTLFDPYAAAAHLENRSTGTLFIQSDDISVRNLTIDNGIYLDDPAIEVKAFPGPVNTVVLRDAERITFDNVLIKGGQDTLYHHSGISYFHRCEVWGSVDFIYGGGLAVFDHCRIVQIRNTGGPICAPSTPAEQPFGEVFLDCHFPQALKRDGFPYDVEINSTTFMRPWRSGGATAIIRSVIGPQITPAGWGQWDGRENHCRAIEWGTTLEDGTPAPTPAERRTAGAYWLNSRDPDYTTSGMTGDDPLLAPPDGPKNRIPIEVDPDVYTLEAIFGHPALDLDGWLPQSAR